MRGPGMRIDLDVRRLWRCPRCGAERSMPASVTSLRCHCSTDTPFMQYIERPRRARPEFKPVDPYDWNESDAAVEAENAAPPGRDADA